MKDILKIMRFDFLTAKPFALVEFIIFSFFCLILSLLFSPMICSYIIFGAMIFVIPLQNIADKNDFKKLYGILPVKRRNITRARFIYIFTVHFLTEIIEILFAFISVKLKLYRILPNQDSEMLQMIKNSFNSSFLTFVLIFSLFSLLCLIFTYIEMMGQIYGRENEFKILMITIGVIAFIIMGFLVLSNRGIIPVFSVPKLPASTSGRVMLAVVLNIILFGISILFGEITAAKLEKREL